MAIEFLVSWTPGNQYTLLKVNTEQLFKSRQAETSGEGAPLHLCSWEATNILAAAER